MDVTFDRHLFTQVGLDSGSLTMLGSVVHAFAEPGEYRCAVHAGKDVKAVFVVHADPDSPNAHAVVDLESLVSGASGPPAGDCGCQDAESTSAAGVPRYEVNPRGHVLFRVGRGAGQYYVHARRTDAGRDDKGYDTRTLAAGDAFAAVVIRPGTYAVSNALTGAQGELVVDYPPLKERRYRPSDPVRVKCDAKAFSPAKVRVGPGQGVIFESLTASRVAITLTRPDDGPADRTRVRPPRRFTNVASARRDPR
jgi:plastocyanin